MSRREVTLTGVVLDEEEPVTLGQLCRCCGVDAEFVTEMVEYGIVEPVGDDPHRWRFAGPALRRVTTVVRLNRDLGVNLPGAALAVELLDELAELRRRRG